jgi:hypothetical protein
MRHSRRPPAPTTSEASGNPYGQGAWRNGVDSGLWPASSQRSASGCGSRRSLNRARARDGLGCLDWPCDQNPGRRPAISRRAIGARDAGAPGEQDSTAGPATTDRAGHSTSVSLRRRASWTASQRSETSSRARRCGQRSLLRVRTQVLSVGGARQDVDHAVVKAADTLSLRPRTSSARPRSFWAIS